MHGRPFIQWALFLGVWACVAFPIAQLTRREHAVAKAQVRDAASVMTWVSLRFSEAPLHFELRQRDKVLWHERSPNSLEFERAFPVALDEFGADLLFRSRLPASGVIEITIEPDEHGQRSQTLWVDEEVDEALSFSWSRHD